MLVLVPVLIGLFLITVAELGHPAAGKVRRTGIIAALTDPLALFAARSPGERGAGALLSTKPGGPSERVLSEVRDRDPAAAGDPPADVLAPATPADVAALPNGLPGDASTPGSAGGPGGGGAPGGGFPGGSGFAPSFLPFSRDTSSPGGPGDPPIIGSPPPPAGGVSAVPEPATWAMLILGFFGAGAALRRSRGRLACARQRR